MSIAIPQQTPRREADVVKLSKRQWRKAAEAKLRELNLTYDELMAQAENKNFVSTAARRLWVLIGGTL